MIIRFNVMQPDFLGKLGQRGSSYRAALVPHYRAQLPRLLSVLQLLLILGLQLLLVLLHSHQRAKSTSSRTMLTAPVLRTTHPKQ